MMKNKITIILFLLIVSIVKLSAQESIYVEETNGTITETPLLQVQKITFSATDMILHKTDAITITWAISDVHKYYYDLSTKAETVSNESIDVLIYPNPAETEINIDYKLDKASSVEISINDLSGKMLEVIFNENLKQGKHSLQYHNNTLQTGTYLIRIEIDNKSIVKKIIIL